VRSDTSEKGLEDLIVAAMTGREVSGTASGDATGGFTSFYGGVGWILGDWHDYDREHAVDLKQLATFLVASQPKVAEAVSIGSAGISREKFLSRLQGEITKRGVIDVLRGGLLAWSAQHRSLLRDAHSRQPESSGDQGGAQRDLLDPILDVSVATYLEILDEDEQIDFKGKAKAFVRPTPFSPASSPIQAQNGRSCRSS